MAKPEYEFHTPTSPWRQTGLDGIEEKVLARDDASGADTTLLRWAPGADSSVLGPQRHTYWEEVYVLSGEMTDLSLNRTFTAGMYACRPPDMEHGPWKSEEGYVAIVFRYGGE